MVLGRNQGNQNLKNNLTFLEPEEDYYKPVRTDKFDSNSYIEYEINGDRNKFLSLKKYVKEVKTYLKNIINIRYQNPILKKLN